MGIVAKNLHKFIGDPPNHILTDIHLEILEGDFVSLTGRSGSGKSSLLYLLSSLDKPSDGVVEIDGQDPHKMDPDLLCHFRNQKMGFVFQFHYLLPELTALENVLFPSRRSGQYERRKTLGKQLLEQFGLGEKMHRYPRQLSGGEGQRVAIARSLVMEPKYLFADEPTGALDSLNGELVMKILLESNAKNQTTVILVTHDSHFASLAKRQIFLSDGRIVDQK
jgi:lipoprotein-releasing system ATP-binding protein